MVPHRVLVVVGRIVEITVALQRTGLRILALIALSGGLLYGLMRLTLLILPEHTGPSLIIQYRLGERDFSGVNLEGPDLTGANLHEANLSGADLRGADLTGAQCS